MEGCIFMKKLLCTLLTLVLTFAAIATLTGCTQNAQEKDIGIAAAEGVLKEYLETKGFGEGDFLSEGETMNIDGVKVYVFSWRVVENEHSDRLFGTYAVSVGGNNFYEYQAERGEWIKDMN